VPVADDWKRVKRVSRVLHQRHSALQRSASAVGPFRWVLGKVKVEVMDGCLVVPQTACSPAEECDHCPEEVTSNDGYSRWNEPVQRERHVHRNVHGIGVDEEHFGAGLV
jgi:hypothetical protein